MRLYRIVNDLMCDTGDLGLPGNVWGMEKRLFVGASLDKISRLDMFRQTLQFGNLPEVGGFPSRCGE
ncbi:MAG: hypothetical protein HFH56_13995 [Lachnospiraceae bacterium]|nr:hypothetical protein [Lachnospiraceae bacterium]